jgi:hypothetical protein
MQLFRSSSEAVHVQLVGLALRACTALQVVLECSSSPCVHCIEPTLLGSVLLHSAILTVVTAACVHALPAGTAARSARLLIGPATRRHASACKLQWVLEHLPVYTHIWYKYILGGWPQLCFKARVAMNAWPMPQVCLPGAQCTPRPSGWPPVAATLFHG